MYSQTLLGGNRCRWDQVKRFKEAKLVMWTILMQVKSWEYSNYVKTIISKTNEDQV